MSLAEAAADASAAIAATYPPIAAFATALVREATAWPFGALNSLHWGIVGEAVGFTTLRVAVYLAPFGLLYAQCYLLFEAGTRYTRLALGAACLAGMWSAWTGTRFTSKSESALSSPTRSCTEDPWHNAWNHVVTMPYVQFMVKCLEFSFLKDPIRDARNRPRALAAYDLLINSRMIGLGNVGLDVSPGISNVKVPAGYVERHLQSTLGPRPKRRWASVLRHAGYSALCYTVIDFAFSLMRRQDPVFQQPYGGKGVVMAIASRSFTLFPDVLAIPVPKAVVVVLIEAAIGGVVWMTFEGFYQLFAALHVALGWPIDAWDPNMFGSPWRADSLIDLWGKRWHQTFRHMFIVSSTVLLSALRLPVTAQTLFFGTFFFSGAIHCVSEMAMDPVGSPGQIMMFFFLAGAGCAAEVTFKRATGRKVHGGWGQLWTWGYMALIGRIVTCAWVDSGYAGCHFLPPALGDLMAAAVPKYVLAVE